MSFFKIHVHSTCELVDTTSKLENINSFPFKSNFKIDNAQLLLKKVLIFLKEVKFILREVGGFQFRKIFDFILLNKNDSIYADSECIKFLELYY